jgi:hypothetical protein
MPEEESAKIFNNMRMNLTDRIMLAAIRVMPVYDPELGIVPYESMARRVTSRYGSDELSDTPLGQDPVGTAFRLTQGYYSPKDFIRDHGIP